MQSGTCSSGAAPAAHGIPLRIRNKADTQVYSLPVGLSVAQDKKRRARLVSSLSAAIAADHFLPSELRGMHKEACTSICAVATELQRCSSAPHMPTYINAYFMWRAWLKAMCSASTLLESDPKHESIKRLKQLSFRRTAVMIPAVCFWLSVKCTETWAIGVNDLACMIGAVEQRRADCAGTVYTLRELCQAEHDVLQLLDWDLLVNQDKIDGMEDILEAHFNGCYSSAKVQSEVVLLLFGMFNDICG